MAPLSGKTDMARTGLTGRKVLLILIAFFGVIFAVNGVFLYVALDSHPGLTTDDAYREGMRFNDEIARADAQKALGWKTGVSYREGVFAADVRDRNGDAVPLLQATAYFSRPVHSDADRRVELKPGKQGRYAAPVSLDPGAWRVTVELKSPAGRTAHFNGRLEVPR